MVMLTKIKINGVDVSAHLINYEYETSYGDVVSQIEINFVRTITNIIILSEGALIEIWRGWITSTEEKIFKGYIEQYVPDGGKIKIYAKDKLWDLVRKELTHSYISTIDASAGKISEIFKDIVTTYGGLNADATSIQDSGTTIIIQEFKCNHTDPMDRCKKLADILDWQFYYRADTDKAYFEPKGFTNNSTILSVGINIISIPKWNYDITEMVNDVTIVGAYQEVETTKSGQIGVTSGFTTTSISLDYEPISVKVYGDAGNPPTTLKTGGLPESTTSFDYYVDKTQKKIYPAPGTTFTTNQFYEIRYSAAVPIPVNIYNQASIDLYGRFQKTITYKDLRNMQDAENRAINYLAYYSIPFLYTTLKIQNNSDYGLAVGQRVLVVDDISTPKINEQLQINKYRIRYPSDYDELDVGDKFWRLAEFQAKLLEKIKRIDEDEFSNEDILNNIINVDNSINPIEITSRYFKVLKKIGTPGLDNFILGTSILGTGILGDFELISEVNHSIQQSNNIYTEEFYDTDFEDTGSTTATWNTTYKWLEFGGALTGQSLSIDYNNGTITSGTLTVVSGSDDYIQGHYVFSNNTKDASGNGTDGTATGVIFVDGIIGLCAEFVGGSSKIDIGTSSTFDYERTQPISFSFWVNKNTIGATQTIFSKYDTTGVGVGYYIAITSLGEVILVLDNNSSSNRLQAYTTTLLSANTWHHIVVTYDGSSSASGVKIYINSVSDTLGSIDALSGSILNSKSPQIGAKNSTANFAGKLDDVRLYTTVLSQANVNSLFNNGQGTENAVVNFTGRWNLFLSADGGSNWEAVSNGVAHIFTNTGTDLRWKITCNSGGFIQKAIISDYH